MIKRAKHGQDARSLILSGVQKISKAVKATLGPLGRNVMIASSVEMNYAQVSLPLHVTKDGYNTAKAFNVEDPFERAGVDFVKEAAQKTVDQAGDGTTTTVVLLEAIVTEGMKMIDEGANPIQLKREIDASVSYVVDYLKEIAVQVTNDEEIFKIATISANNDPEIGRIVSDTFTMIGKGGIIDIKAGSSVQTEVKFAEGYRFSQSFLSPMFINKKEKQIVELENPLILLYEKVILHHTQYQRAAELAMQAGRPLFIICEDGKEEGLATLIINNARGTFSTCVVKSPSFGEQRRLEMEDMAILTGGTYISDAKGIEIKEIEFENFGQADKVIVNKEETIIIGGRANKTVLQNHIETLEMDKASAKNEDEAFPIEKRIARIKGGVAIIEVGGPTETEMKERLDRFDDSVRATKSAIAEGYVPGGGIIFNSISGDDNLNKSEGGKLLAKILKTPIEQICENAGLKWSEVWGGKKLSKDMGFNAKENRWENLVEAGIIDPAKVLRCSLQNAASSATMILTTECLIVDTY